MLTWKSWLEFPWWVLSRKTKESEKQGEARSLEFRS